MIVYPFTSPMADLVWSGVAPYKFKGSYGEKTSTLSDALGGCSTDKKCKGVNFNGKTYQVSTHCLGYLF